MKSGPWAFEPYAETWDGTHEYFTFIVPELAEQSVHERIGDKAKLKDFLSTLVGRTWDRDRLAGIALRVTQEQRIEVRMQYLPPWFVSKGRLADSGRRVRGTNEGGSSTAEQGGAGSVSEAASAQQRIAAIFEQSIGGVQRPSSGDPIAERTGGEGHT